MFPREYGSNRGKPRWWGYCRYKDFCPTCTDAAGWPKFLWADIFCADESSSKMPSYQAGTEPCFGSCFSPLRMVGRKGQRDEQGRRLITEHVSPHTNVQL